MLKIKNFGAGTEITTEQSAELPPKRRPKPAPRRSKDIWAKPGTDRRRRDEEVAKQILLRAATGMSHVIIAKMFNLTDHMLHKLYQPELDDGLEIANSEVAGRLYTAATRGNIVAMIFWLKSRAGWREIDKHEHEHKHKFQSAYDIDKMSEAELQAEIARLRAQDDALAGRETAPPARPERPNGLVH